MKNKSIVTNILIVSLMREHGMSVKEMSLMSGIPARTIYQWIKNERKPAPYIYNYFRLLIKEVEEHENSHPRGTNAPIIKAERV